ncbi:MAG: hypothetical protein ACP5OG_01910 [Candidatus Nanoarchaeia archaeon]
MKKILFFYGGSCPHCHAMMPLADKISKEFDIDFIRLEVWSNPENADKMRSFAKIIREACGGELGVPAFIQEDSKKAFCGEKEYSEFKEWIKSL